MRRSLSPDHVHGELQGVLHAVGLPLVGPRKAQRSFSSSYRTKASHRALPGVYLGQLDGLRQFVHGALQVRQLVGTQHAGEGTSRHLARGKCGSLRM